MLTTLASKLIGAGILLAAILGGLGYIYHLGGKSERQEQAAEQARMKVELAVLRSRAGQVTTKVEYITQEKIKYIQVKGETREKIVEKLVPIDSGSLAGGFRVYHDAAVQDRVPDSSEVGAPVAVTDVARTLNYNYTQCHKAYAEVAAWEKWYEEQAKLHAGNSVVSNSP